jgi:hypothetical protein
MFRAARPGSTITLRRTDGIEVRLTLDRQDPVLGALIDHASKQKCSRVRRGHVPPAKAEALRSKVFVERRFRCDDAHKALATVLEPGDIVLVRGSKRILLANPGWATVCVQASAVDGGDARRRHSAAVREARPGLRRRPPRQPLTRRAGHPWNYEDKSHHP